jgi:hypothetical protein
MDMQTRTRSGRGLPVSYDAHSHGGEGAPRVLTCPGSEFVNNLVEWLGRVTRISEALPRATLRAGRAPRHVLMFYAALLWKGTSVRVGDTVELTPNSATNAAIERTRGTGCFRIEAMFEVSTPLDVSVAENLTAVDADPLLFSAHQRDLWQPGGKLHAQQPERCADPSECRLLAPGRAFIVVTPCSGTETNRDCSIDIPLEIELRYLCGRTPSVQALPDERCETVESIGPGAVVSEVLDMALAGEQTWRQTRWAQRMWRTHISLLLDEIGCCGTMGRWVAAPPDEAAASTACSSTVSNNESPRPAPTRGDSLPRAWTRILAADFQLTWIHKNSTSRRNKHQFNRYTHEVRVRGEQRRLASCAFCAKICRVDKSSSTDAESEQARAFVWSDDSLQANALWVDGGCYHHIRRCARTVAMMQTWRRRIQAVLVPRPARRDLAAWCDPYHSAKVVQTAQEALQAMLVWEREPSEGRPGEPSVGVLGSKYKI